VKTLIYQHSIFSDRCTSTSLDCPYNIVQIGPVKKTTLPVYILTSPVYENTSPVYKSTTPVYKPKPPVHKPITRVYEQVPAEQPLLPPVHTPEPTKQETGKLHI
jgi:hypothetical protein